MSAVGIFYAGYCNYLRFLCLAGGSLFARRIFHKISCLGKFECIYKIGAKYPKKLNALHHCTSTKSAIETKANAS